MAAENPSRSIHACTESEEAMIAMRMVDFLGGKKWKKVENTVGNSKTEELSSQYYLLFNIISPA